MDSSKKDDYYRQLIVKHYNNPVNKGLLRTENSIIFHHYSNSCVDDFYIELVFKNGVVVFDAKFEGMGCAISTASIDIFLSLIANKNIKEITNIDKNYQAMLKNELYDEELLADLNAFHNVFKQSNRIKCALIISESIRNISLIKESR